MAEYHVKLNENGDIIAGSTTKSGKFSNSSIVTEETLAAVRDHLLRLIANKKQDMMYAWNYPNGKTILLKLEEKDTTEIKDEAVK